MKISTLNLFLFNIFSIISIAYGVDSQDCLLLNDFLKRDLNTPCCNDGISLCNNEGQIFRLYLNNTTAGEADFMNFPIFPKLTEISIGIKGLNGNRLPAAFFDQPQLLTLSVYNSNISTIQENINFNCPVDQINLEHNKIKEFPYHFSKLPKLTKLYFWDNDIDGIIDLKNFKTLRQIDISGNHVSDVINFPTSINVIALNENPIKEVPKEIPYLTDLNVLQIANTEITELPPDLFKLDKLKKLNISNNLELNTELINFGENSIEYCYIKNTPILCLQENTCQNVDVNYIDQCTSLQINNIKSKQNINNDNLKNKIKEYIKNNRFIIFTVSIVVLIIIMISFICCCCKKKSEKDDKKYDIVVTENIKKIRVYEQLSSMDSNNDNYINNKNNSNIEINNNVHFESNNNNINYENNYPNNFNIDYMNKRAEELDNMERLPSYRTRDRSKYISEKPPTYSFINAIPVNDIQDIKQRID
ncbi:L domain-like protein [Anaeromyces robustus]|jgi:hypothetical protein|uniref:L domain-like protein n=1 Tax=Anaeromyces robustus TaxID=1754192 RepID=A0A1Y1VV69_9FUNG|nr:L domain-like protein [Anaeromyces robustus]|eukprot:ORX64664.1 L domain-like protein [Anaeromyces robustus]